MNRSNSAVTLSARILPELFEQLNELSLATGRTKSFLTSEAIKNYLIAQSWQIKAIKAAIKKADSEEACFIDHQKVKEWVDSWDSANEKKMPE